MQVNDPRSDILNLLKRKDSSVDTLSSQLGISSTATRQHLSILERDGLVARRLVHEKVGRPKVFYSLTEKAEESFPKLYSNFLRWILADMIEREGPEAVRAMLGRLGTKHASEYKERVGSNGNVEAVVDLLNELGCIAELERDDGHTVIKQYNCYIYEAAMEFGDIACEFALKFIGSLLNEQVELTSSIAKGDRYCSFAVNGKSVL